jgi:alpha-tubulin suppressor-like RCC1 family protein
MRKSIALLLVLTLITTLFISSCANKTKVTQGTSFKNSTNTNFSDDGGAKKSLEFVTNRIAGGDLHSLMLKTDGTVWAWGSNSSGQLGDGTIAGHNTPVQVSGLIDVVSISAGSSHSLALKKDGTVWAWGDNDYGQLGDGTLIDRKTPVRILEDVIAIAAGNNYSLALKVDGTVWSWGHNSNGELGNGTTDHSYSPVQVSSLTDVKAITSSKFCHNFAVKSDGTVWAWGCNEDGQLGIGSADSDPHTVPVQVPGLTDVVSVSAGTFHSLALKKDGTVWAWGKNYHGQLGDGTTTDRKTPVQVRALKDVTAIAAGGRYSLALKSDGTLLAWGFNFEGQVGDGTSDERLTPVQILNDVAAVSAGYQHSLALKKDGTVWAWGYNDCHQVSYGIDTTCAKTPIRVKIP